MKLETHPHSRSNHSPQQLHVGEYPLIPHGRDAEVSLKERVEAMEEEIHT